MIFPKWSENAIANKDISIDTKFLKKQPEQLEFNFDLKAKDLFDGADDAFTKLLNKLSKKFSSIDTFSNSSNLNLDQYINTKTSEFILEKDHNQLLTSTELEIQQCCNYYGIDPQNVTSIKVEVQEGTFMHRITIEKDLF